MGKKRAPKEVGNSLISSHRKKEVLGLFLMVAGILLALAIVTYNSADDRLAKAFSLGNALNPGESAANNALGLIGSFLSAKLVPGWLGYLSIVVSILGFGWGYLLFRHKTRVYLPLLSILTMIGALLVSATIAWFGRAFTFDTTVLSGAWGQGISGWMHSLFGGVGSLIILFFTLSVIALLIVDRDIQRSIDRVEDLLFRIREAFKDWNSRTRAHRAARKKMLATEKDRRQAQRQRVEQSIAERPPKKRKVEISLERPSVVLQRKAKTVQRAASVAAGGSGNGAPPTDRSSGKAPPPAKEPGSDSSVGMSVRQQVAEEKSSDLGGIVSQSGYAAAFEMPSLSLLDPSDAYEHNVDYDELEENKQILLDKLATYNIEIVEINAIVGPTVTLYELTPAPGVKISRIKSLEDDLAMALAAKGIRMIAPIPGKSAIGVEIPNRQRELVRVTDVIGTSKFTDQEMELPCIIGKTIEGEVFITDLTKLPHLLIAGATGSGKSVGLNAIITGLLYACPPSDLKFVMIDPKKIELQPYTRISDHYVAMPEDFDHPIITDVTQALATLKCCEKEMEDRYNLLSKAQVRGVRDYNEKFGSGDLDPEDDHRHLPYIVVIVDELADLMMTAGKDIEGPIARLAQMARAVGIHLVLATQRPSVDVITGLIKANFPARLAYQVASKIDSRTILDQNGAQGLVGNGDLLYMLGTNINRLQGPFVSMKEVDRLTKFIQSQKGDGPYHLPGIEDEIVPTDSTGLLASERDDLFVDAARVIVRSQQGSVSLLQRKLSVGYSRAARIVDQLEVAGIVGPFEGSKARKVLVPDEFELDEMLSNKN